MPEIVVIASIAEDLLRFKTLTMGNPCIMGRTTYKFLPKWWEKRTLAPLAGRENIVLSRFPNYSPPGVTVFHDLQNAIAYCGVQQSEKVFVIGGASVYRQALHVADTLELTRIHRCYDGEVSFPDFHLRDWRCVWSEPSQGFDRCRCNLAVDLTFETYRRK